MATETAVSIGEYLSTCYRPDREYIDGEWDHGSTQAPLASYFVTRRKEWGVDVSTEQRVQVLPAHFRIPDVCVVQGRSHEQILTNPPSLCIEVLSKDDRLSEIQERLEALDGVLRCPNTPIAVPLAEVLPES